MKVFGHEIEFGQDGSFVTARPRDLPDRVVLGRTRIEALKKLIDKLEKELK